MALRVNRAIVSKKASFRCQKPGVASHCPESCRQCGEYKCADSKRNWHLKNGKTKTCGWVGRSNTETRCAWMVHSSHVAR